MDCTGRKMAKKMRKKDEFVSLKKGKKRIVVTAFNKLRHNKISMFF